MGQNCTHAAGAAYVLAMREWIRPLDRVLKGEATRPEALRGGSVDIPLARLSLVLLLLGMFYGLCMGAYAVITRWGTAKAFMGWQQAAASAVKVPLLFFLTLLVTLPSLYVFNALVGSRLTLRSVVRLLVAALAVMLALQASFGTIVVFFSVSTTSYPFMVLLNVVMFSVSGFLGLGFLLQTLHRLSQVQTIAAEPPITPPPAPPVDAEGSPPRVPGPLDRARGERTNQSVKTVFRIWVLLFGLVGAQMGWVLRPFVGHPRADFTFFRERKQNFFQAVETKVEEVFGADRRNGNGQ
jgi:hypothetical protein